jgi:hypothetical protein
MKYRHIMFILLVLIPGSAHGQDGVRKYLGGSGCRPEFRRAPGLTGIRLDKAQQAYLKTYMVDHQNILLIVQFSGDQDKCGVVRDAVQPQDATSSFEWECSDNNNRSAVVVGTWPEKHPTVSGAAVEAWRIDLNELRFVHLNVPVSCYERSYAGPDGGEDLAGWARGRVAKQKPANSSTR